MGFIAALETLTARWRPLLPGNPSYELLRKTARGFCSGPSPPGSYFSLLSS